MRVYEYSGSSWSQLGADINGEAAGDYSGYSVSLSSDGTIVAIGAPDNDGNGSNSGHVRVYEYSGSSWSQLGTDIDGEAANDYSGYSVSLSSDGTKVAIGAHLMMEMDLIQGMCVFMSILIVLGVSQSWILMERLLMTTQDILFL